jgi:hypothetical protein
MIGRVGVSAAPIQWVDLVLPIPPRRSLPPPHGGNRTRRLLDRRVRRHLGHCRPGGRHRRRGTRAAKRCESPGPPPAR